MVSLMSFTERVVVVLILSLAFSEGGRPVLPAHGRPPTLQEDALEAIRGTAPCYFNGAYRFPHHSGSTHDLFCIFHHGAGLMEFHVHSHFVPGRAGRWVVDTDFVNVYPVSRMYDNGDTVPNPAHHIHVHLDPHDAAALENLLVGLPARAGAEPPGRALPTMGKRPGWARTELRDVMFFAGDNGASTV